MAWYTDWYIYDFEEHKDKKEVMRALSVLPELMKKDTNKDRPSVNDMWEMLDGLREVYDAYKPDYVLARSIAVILKTLCDLGRTKKTYDKALSDNISEYLELSSYVLNSNSKTLAEIKKYCASRTRRKKFLDGAKKYILKLSGLFRNIFIKNNPRKN